MSGRSGEISVDLRRLLASGRWAAQIAWSTNATLLLAVAGVVLSRGLIPAAMALSARGLVNATVAALSGGTTSMMSLVPWLLLGFVLTLLEGIGQVAQTLFSRRLQDDLNYRITLDVLNQSARLDVASYDDPRFQDVLRRAKEHPAENVSPLRERGARRSEQRLAGGLPRRPPRLHRAAGPPRGRRLRPSLSALPLAPGDASLRPRTLAGDEAPLE